MLGLRPMTAVVPVPEEAPPRSRRLLAGQPGRRSAHRRPFSLLPTAFVLAGLPFMRPNILGESRQSIIGLALLVTAAVLHILLRSLETRGNPDPVRPASSPAGPAILCLGLGYLWLMMRAAATDPGPLTRPTIQGTLLTVGSVAALAIVCREPATRLAVGRGFVLLLALLCASYVVTALVWTVAGIGTGVVTTLSIGTSTGEPVYFPFTPTLGVQTVFGAQFPRFTGLGREPGWMAMYCAAAYFMADSVGLRSKWLKLLLVAGLIGSISTAGFGVFVVAWAYHAFLRDRGTGIALPAFLRQVFGLVAMAGAIWVAVAAPVLGLSAKATQNQTSLDERKFATAAGVRALFTHPWGGQATEVQSGINLISDIAANGLPFVLAVGAAVLLPMRVEGAAGRYSNSVAVIAFLTLLTSQPAQDSTWVFGLVVLAAMLRMPDMEPLVPLRGTPILGGTSERP